MAFSRVLSVSLALLAVALPAAASAAPRGQVTAAARLAASDPVAAAVAVSHRYWSSTPCQGRVTVLPRRALSPGVDPATDAWVTFGSATGANDLSAPASSYTDCAISLARWRWPTTASMREDWDLFCLTVVHETGHLLGHAHDDTPGSVMAPVFSDLSSEPALCRASRPAAAARSGASARS